MARYVGLLRGVNVGGKQKVPMQRLRDICVDLGCTDVATLLNSGNVVFTRRRSAVRRLAASLEAAILQELGVECRVLVKTATDVAAIADAIPDDWSNGDGMKADVVYLFDDIDPREAIDELQPRDGIDHVVVAPGAVLWMVHRENATRNGLLKLVGTPLYRATTVRNVNTARALAKLATE